MAEGVKFSEEEMIELRDIQESYVTVQNDFGQLTVTKIRLQQQLDNVLKFEDEVRSKFQETQNKEKEFISKITKTYGEGQLDTKSGVFTKNN